MSAPSLPSGYDETKHVLAGRRDCHITVGFDQYRAWIPRFLIQLHYQTATDPVQWTAIARMDHNEMSVTGHDVYKEGLHVDVARRSGGEVHLKLSHGSLSPNVGTVIRRCSEYFKRETDYFIDVYEEQRTPGGPPSWSPDGGNPAETGGRSTDSNGEPADIDGNSTPMFFTLGVLDEDMSRESPIEDALTLDELTEVLADATNTTPEEIERGADEIEIGPPEEATVVDDGE